MKTPVATIVPPYRMYRAESRSEKNSAELRILRDPLLNAHDCSFAIFIGEKLAARIGPNEEAVFNLEPGESHVTVKRDPTSERGCVSRDNLQTDEKITLAPGETKSFSLTFLADGWPILKPLPASVPPPTPTTGFSSRPVADVPREPSAVLKLAQKPPMGWEGWNHFGAGCAETNERVLRQMADAMVASGMRDAGYEYIRIDECWQGGRDSNGVIYPDPKRFPSGMKALADYVHSKGLKLGIYTDVGPKTCLAVASIDPQEKLSSHDGSLGHEFEDARQYAAWEVDHVKNDWCFSRGLDGKTIYGKMAQAIQATGRPMVYNICGWGIATKWAESIGAQTWRTGPDIENNWKSVLTILDMQIGLEGYAGPGHWNDPDMLEVGNGGLTSVEEKSHFGLWSLLAAPLTAGNDLRNMSAQTIKILTAKEVIAVNQDSLGFQGRQISKSPNEVWAKPLADGSRAVILFNRESQPAKIYANWKDIWLQPKPAKVRDLWAERDLGNFRDSFSAVVEPHGIVMIKVTGDPLPNPVYTRQ